MDDSRQEHTQRSAALAEARGERIGVRARSAAARGPEPLSVCVERAVEAYFEDLDGEPATELYDLVLAEVEGPLLATVMRRVGGNQSRAAAILGLNRGTLRKKLKQYGLL